jgi:hypothetical protein
MRGRQRSKKVVAVLVKAVKVLAVWDDDPYKAAGGTVLAVELAWSGTTDKVKIVVAAIITSVAVLLRAELRLRCRLRLQFRLRCGWRSPTGMTNRANNISILSRRGESSVVEPGGEQRVDV